MMIPVGMPLLYFFGGLLAHIGIALTGGAPRSIGASMRAVGYAMAPALLVIGVLDVALYTGRIEGVPYVAILWAAELLFLWLVGWALARTHGISVKRGFLVGALPVLLLSVVTFGRALLELSSFPGLPGPDAPYYVP
jgi:hypothetical protein